MAGGVIQEVGPVGICLHESELKQLSQTQPQELKANLEEGDISVGHPGEKVRARPIPLPVPQEIYLIPDVLTQALALVQRNAPSQLHAQHTCSAQFLHHSWHPEEGVVGQELPGAGRRRGMREIAGGGLA